MLEAHVRLSHLIAKIKDIYHLLTKFKGRTISYGPSFFPIDLWPKCEVRCHKSRGEGENEDL